MKLQHVVVALLCSMLIPAAAQADSDPSHPAGTSPLLPDLIPIAGDWNGDGFDELGWHRPGSQTMTLCTWLLTDDPEPAPIIPSCQDHFLPAMPRPQIPLAGDWDGDGVDEPGLWDPVPGTLNRFYFEDGQLERWDPVSPSGSRPEDWPFVGDWDGDGRDDLGLYSPDTADYALHFLAGGSDSEPILGTYGIPGADWRPIAGLWEGSETSRDRAAFYDPLTATFHFLAGSQGAVTRQLPEGPDLYPLAGSWWSGLDAIGVFDAEQRNFRLYPYALQPTTRPVITVIVQDPDEGGPAKVSD